jgi:hypothetical protein
MCTFSLERKSTPRMHFGILTEGSTQVSLFYPKLKLLEILDL